MPGRLRANISWPWLTVSTLMVLFIWGNSTVPGQGSSSLSLSVVDYAREFLGNLGLPFEWVTNFVVRKGAHFTEYLILAIMVSQAFDGPRRRSPLAFAVTAAVLIAVPCVDETIQLHVPGRSGQVTDVMIDCCGAATGVALRTAVVAARGAKRS